MKKSQWYRYNNEIKQTDNMFVKNKKYEIANTPQELIKVGDLIVSNNGMLRVVYIEENKNYIDTAIGLINKKVITEIWTRIDKDTYKCQWRKGEKDNE